MIKQDYPLEPRYYPASVSYVNLDKPTYTLLGYLVGVLLGALLVIGVA